MGGRRGTNHMQRGRCNICGAEDVAFTKAGKVHPLHEKFNQDHQNAVALRRDMQAVRNEEREANG
jgi:hypothetical protein